MNEPQSTTAATRLKFNNHRAAVFPMLTLLLATSAGAGLVIARVFLSGRWSYLSLIWNLFLAWLPLVFALGVCRQYRAGAGAGWKLWTLAGLWLLFFPNAPYIFTDLIHLNTWFHMHYWADLAMILLVALTGFLLGFVSLYLMQSVVADRLGRLAGWLFIVVVAALSGLGIYIGRFLRWNSWDVFVHPVGLSMDLGRLAAHPLVNARSFVFQALFAAFLFFGYLMLYALTHLQPAQRTDAAA
jgi:uncharacterized membrane protein